MAASNAFVNSFNSDFLPQMNRASSKEVRTVISCSDSEMHSATVLTEEAISRPASQQLATYCSTFLDKD